MKKVLSYILILFIISANLFAPFSVGINKNLPKITKNIVRADDLPMFSIAPIPTSNSIKVEGTTNKGWVFPTGTLIYVYLYDSQNSLVGTEQTADISNSDEKVQPKYSVNFTGLSTTTPYRIKIKAGDLPEREMTGVYTLSADGTIVKPVSSLKTTTIEGTGKNVVSMPSCGISMFGGTLAGCISQIIYYLLFVPTSYLFALAGTFFDYTFSYSVQDSSYRSAFVVQGWGLVRDFCNMFFIFIMLYVAIGTILGIHGVDTKQTIINVVIIGLSINFSLFATQVIIDASNITARVFYNSDSIKITENGANGVANTTPGLVIGEGGVIPLSAALVNKVNPQNIIINSSKIGSIQNKSMSASSDNTDTLTAGTFILVTLLAIGINFVGIMVFASVGLMFIARVIGLWFAMIMAPLAFFTYILPSMEGTKMIGWKNWWPETFKLAFLAPVFIFFLYIILKFLEINLIADPMSKDGLSWLIATIIPFAFIMILLMKAKGIAEDMSGEMGKQITSKIAMAGGLALGAGLGGAAVLGRATLGRAGSALANSKWASTNGAIGRKLGDIGKWAGSSSFDARNSKAGSIFAKETGMDLSGKDTGMGGLIKANEGGFAKVRADKVKARQERAKQLEVHEDEELMQKKNALELQLKSLQDEHHHDLEAIEGKIASRQKDLADKNATATSLEAAAATAAATAAAAKKANNGNADPVLEKEAAELDKEAKGARALALKVGRELQNLKYEKAGIREGGAIKNEKGDITGYRTHNGNMTQTQLDKIIDEERQAQDGVLQAQIELEEAESKVMTIQTDAKEALKTETDAINNALQIELAAIKKTEDDARKAGGGMINDASILNSIKASRDAANTKASEAITAAKAKADEMVSKANISFNDATNNVNSAINMANNAIQNANTARDSVAKGGIGKSMDDLEYGDITKAKSKISHENMHRKTAYAEEVNSDFNRVVNFITSGGEHSGNGAREAAYKIRMESKVESGSHGGGGGGHSAPAAHAPAPAAKKEASHEPADNAHNAH